MTGDYVFLFDIELYAHWNLDQYQVTLVVSDPGYGSLSPEKVDNQPCGTLYSVDSNDLIIGNIRITPIPANAYDGNTYEFAEWLIDDDEVTSSPIVNAVTFTARFVKYCEVTLAASEKGYGTLDPNMVADRLEGTKYSVDGDTLTIGDTDVKATPAEAGDGYAYEFAGWFVGDEEATAGTIESPVAFTARFVKYCAVTLKVSEEGYGSLDPANIGQQPEGAQYSVDGDTLTIGDTDVKATPAEAGDGYAYEFAGWFAGGEEITTGSIESPIAFTARFSKCYPVSLEVSEEGYGSLDPANIGQQPEGTRYTAEGNVLTIGDSTITAKASDDGQYNYEFVGWLIGDKEATSGTIDGPTTFTASFTRFFDPEIGATFTVDGVKYTIVSFFIAPTVKAAGNAGNLAKVPPVVKYQGIDYVVDKYKALMCSYMVPPLGPLAYASALFDGAGFDPDIGAKFTVDGLEYTIMSFIDAPAVKVTGYARDVGSAATVPPMVRYQGIDYTVQSVGSGALAGCPARSMTVGVDIEAHAFQGSAVRTLRLTEGVTGIAEGAFGSCAKLSDVTFPNTLKQVGKDAFGSCTFSAGGSVLEPTAENLSGHRFVGDKSCLEVYVPPVGTTFSSGGVRYVVLSNQEEMTAGVMGLEMPSKTLTVPESAPYLGFDWSVTTICPGAFYGNPYLTEIDLGMVKTVGSRAFANCCNLRTLTMSHVETLGECCFSNCCSLKSLDLQPVKAIGPGSFSQCSGLRQVSFGDTLEIVGAGAFSKTTFYGQNGKPVPKTADGLRGHSFEGSGGKLRLVAA